MIQEELRPGDRIRFKEAFVTEWVPLKPGQVWCDTKYQERSASDESHLETLRKGEEFTTYGVCESSKDFPPLGVVRIPLGQDRLRHAALSLTTVDSWCCDLGVPLVVSESVYRAFVERKVRSSVAEASIEGVLHAEQIPLLHPEHLKQLGSQITDEFLTALATPSAMPSVYIEVTTPFDIAFRAHNSHPPGCMWAIERVEYNVPLGGQRDSVLYEYLTTMAALHDRNDIRGKVNAFKMGSPVYEEELINENYRHPAKKSIEVLTEFDAQNHYFDAKVPLIATPWRDPRIREEIDRILRDLFKKKND